MDPADPPTASPGSHARPLRVCYFGTYRSEYSRNRIMIAGLRSRGVEVVECHRTLWRGLDDRVQVASGGWRSLRFLWRLASVYAGLFRDFSRVGDFDILMVGYPGQLDAFPARLLSRLRRRPLVMDVFMSISLIARERGLDARSPLTDRLLHRLEGAALRLPDALIQDTQDYRDWLVSAYGLAAEHIHLVPTGADDRIFSPPPESAAPASREITVIYYGTFIPNHGVGHIMAAAAQLKDHAGIRFLLIGDGPDKPAAQAKAEREQLANVHFEGWQEPEQLVSKASRADICLGAFGTTPQSLMTVQNKIYEGLAMRKPVITGDSKAVRRVLRHGEHVYLTDRENPHSLAQAVVDLQANPDLRLRLAENGYRLFKEHYTIEGIGRKSTALLTRLAGIMTHAA